MEVNICSRFTLLKALAKSISRIHLEVGGILGLSRTGLTAWTIASAPLGTATPSCKGERISGVREWTEREIHLEVNLRNTSPTAMGR